MKNQFKEGVDTFFTNDEGSDIKDFKQEFEAFITAKEEWTSKNFVKKYTSTVLFETFGKYFKTVHTLINANRQLIYVMSENESSEDSKIPEYKLNDFKTMHEVMEKALKDIDNGIDSTIPLSKSENDAEHLM